MPRKAKELTAKHVRDLKKPGLHAVGGVAGLQLQIKLPSAKSWVLRTMIGSKRRDIGLGGFPDVGLAQAREIAREFKQQIAQGIDPIEHRRELKQALLKKQRQTVHFKKVAMQCHAVKAQEFKNHKHASQWINTLETYAFPIIGEMHIDTIDEADVLNVLQPIWSNKTETATRLRQRIASVFDHAIAYKLRTKPNPANWKGCLQPLLPNPSSLKRKNNNSGKHLPALPVGQMSEFIRVLRTKDGAGSQALLFAILTAARSGEVVGSTWDEIDFDKAVWKISASRMKAQKDHEVPLSKQALDLLRDLKTENDSGHIFLNAKGQVISDATMNAVIKRLHTESITAGLDGYKDPHSGRRVTPHGFRSTFKEWSRQDHRYPDEWSELALAHVNNDKTRAAYARSKLFDERKGMMQEWADYCFLENEQA